MRLRQEELVRRCQYFAKQQHVSAYKLVTIPPTWPFACRGLDMIGPLLTAPGGFDRVLVAVDNSPSGSRSSRSHASRPTEYSTSSMNSCIATDYPIASSQTWAPTSTITSSGSNTRTAGSTSDMSQLSILGPTDKSSVPTGWYSTLSRSDCTMLLTQKEASGSRNYPIRSGGCVLNPPSEQDNPPAPKQFSPPTSCGICWQ
jgi:hypothetical protein